MIETETAVVTRPHDASQCLAPQNNEMSSVIIALLKGIVDHERDASLWSALLKLQVRVREYLSVLGLQLYLDEAEGHAFLRTRPDSDDGTASPIPRLVSRHQLSFHVSLLLALLRKKLAEFDATGGDTRLVLTRDDIVDLIRLFLPAGTNEAKLITQIERHLNKVIELGFLRRMKSQSENDERYEVLRILKTFVDGQWLSDFDERLAQYKAQLATTESEGETSED